MAVLWLFAAWAVLSLLATLFFAVGGSLGYRRGWEDARTALPRDEARRHGCRPRTHRRAHPGTRGASGGAEVSPHLVRRYAMHGAAWRQPPSTGRGRVDGRPGARRSTGLRLSAGAALASLVFLLPGTAIASSAALPGEPLWSVKRGLENLRIATASGSGDGAQVHVDLAARRLGELTDLLGRDVDAAVVSSVSGDLRAHTSAAQQGFAEMDASDARAVALQRRLRTVVDRHVDLLATMLVLDCETATAADPGCATLDAARAASEELFKAQVTQEPGSQPDHDDTAAGTRAPAERSGGPPGERRAGVADAGLDDDPLGVPESSTARTAAGDDNVTPTLPADPVAPGSETAEPAVPPASGPEPSPLASPSEPSEARATSQPGVNP